MTDRPDKLVLHNQELLTDEVQEVISYRPHFIVRWGNSIFLLIILLLLALTWVIKYPDTINASAKLEAINPPIFITARVEGKLLKLFVTDGQQVIKGQPLGYMESTADYNNVILLQNWIDSIVSGLQNSHIELIQKKPLPELSRLGELQTVYQEFQNTLELTKQTMAGGYYQRKQNALQQDLNYLASLKTNSQQQKELIEQDKQLDAKELDAYETLAKDKVIAPLELNQYKSKLIAKEQSLKQVNSQMTSTDISRHGKKKEILDLQKQVADLKQQFYSSLLSLKSSIEKWIQQYVLTAPEDGRAFFLSALQENKLIANGEGLFYIQPPQTSFYAELMTGQKGFGKIKKGQPVIIKVESYPAREFGYLKGFVSYISTIPRSRDSFVVRVELLNGLKTNYGRDIFFRNGLVADAEIITDNRRLSDRLIGRLKEIISR